MSNTVAEIFTSLGVRMNSGQWAKGTAAIQSMRRSVVSLDGAYQKTGAKADGLASKLGQLQVAAMAFLGIRAAGKALVGFNSTVEDTRNQIAGMMALAKRTGLGDQYAAADKTLASLQKRAATLPGTTAEYAKMLGLITQPVLDAKLGMQELEDITVGAVVAAKALGVESEVAARDIDQAIRGQFKSVDQLTGKLLGSIGYKGEAGRAKFNKMSAERRAAVLKEALTQKQITQLAEAQGKTFSGVMSTLKDTIQQFFGKVGLPLFKAITDQIKSWNLWLEENKEAVQRFGAVLAGALSTAFTVLSEVAGVAASVLGFFLENEGVLRAVIIGITTVMTALGIKAAAAWVMAFAPVILAIAAVSAVVLVVQDLLSSIVDGKGVIASVVKWMVDRWLGLGRAITNVFRSIGRFFVNIAASVKSAFVSVINWITSKIEWAWAQIKKVGHAIANPGEFIEGAIDYVTGTENTPAAAATAAPTRAVPKAPKMTTNVTVEPATTVNFKGNIPTDWIDTKIDTKIKQQHERTWQDAAAATGAEDEGE